MKMHERRERNKMAAYNYRMRMKEEMDKLRDENNKLKSKYVEMLNKVIILENKVKQLFLTN